MKEWISVDERLPDASRDALVWAEGYWHIAEFRKDERRFYNQLHQAVGASEVTHWMPLPDPPAK